MSQEIYKAAILPLREKLFNLALKHLKDEQDAEDATQEVLLKLWHLRNTLTQYENVAAFSTTVLKNHCVDKLRTRNRTVTLDDKFNQHPATDNPYQVLEQKSSSDLIRKIIDTLPELQQAIIRMKDMEEYEIEEIAAITGTKPEAVRVNLSRARKKVRAEFLKLSNY